MLTTGCVTTLTLHANSLLCPDVIAVETYKKQLTCEEFKFKMKRATFTYKTVSEYVK